MTRKQAVLKAIEVLSKEDSYNEVCEALERIISSKLVGTWSKELTLEAVEDFIRENGYYPTLREMDEDDMLPAHASAYIAMGIGHEDMKRKYFPNVPYRAQFIKPSQEEWRERFQALYAELGTPSEDLFDKVRPEGEACADTWKRRLKCKRWSELLRKCGFGHCVRANDNKNVKLTVSTSKSTLSIEDYKKMEQNLEKLLAE